MTSDRKIAYFSMEIGLRTEMPTYSGGLGVLAGDTLRAAADLGVPVVAVTLLYRQGFFRQHIAADGTQTESAPEWEPQRFLTPLKERVTLTLEGREVKLRAWLYHLRGVSGDEVPIYMLDADLPENAPEDAALTGQLYGGDTRYRLRQEALLGLGGVAMLRALGFDGIETYHMNEGHSALLTIALLRERTRDRELGPPSQAEIAAVRSKCVFTTHTPVPAGHDRFPIGMVFEVLGDELAQAIHQLPCTEGHVLNMTYLGLFFSRYVNAVARRHGEVAQNLYPDYFIRSITNGVHAGTWTAPAFADLYDRRIPGWRVAGDMLRRALMIPTEEVMAAHAESKRELMAAIEARSGMKFDPAVMTIGFARRAATYKRADFVLNDLDDLRAISQKTGRLQFVYAGKAHPHDEPAKDIIRRVFAAREELGKDVPIVYLEEHDMSLAKLLTSGVDLWLNNPEKPMEASGTSGMKAALNGVPSLSVLDGWWPEGWIEGVTGWSIGEEIDYPEDPEMERSSLYNKLNYVIVPLYYGAPQNYGRVMRSTIAVNGAYFTAQRMLQQYVLEAYAKGE
jgi:glycogen phosphorylase